MKLKLDDKGMAFVQDGKPVFIGDDGKDVAFDVPGMHTKITALNAENKTHREAKEAAETKLGAFKDIADPAAALKALETVKNLDDKKLVDAGEVEKVKAAAVKGYEDKLTALSTNHAAELKKIADERDATRNQYNSEKVAGAFAGSKFVGEKLTLPADIVQARFGQSFKVEDNKIVGYDAAGNKLMSRSKPGDPADFEEAIEMVVEAYPQKDNILKGTGNNGSGKKPGADGRGNPSDKGKGNMGGTPAERREAIAARFKLPAQ